ncbi:hypothetical protein ABKV19_016804 [Rosa sericea]
MPNHVKLLPGMDILRCHSTSLVQQGVPKQPGGVECGYYVMRYMKDIINDDTLSFSTKWAAKSRNSYTQEQLDEVRIEAADYLQTLL